MSIADAEYQALANAAQEFVWLRRLLRDMGVTHNVATSLYCEHTGAIEITHNDVSHEHTKCIEIECHFIRQHYAQGTIKLQFVSSRDNTIDLFTKSFSEMVTSFANSSLLLPHHLEFEGGVKQESLIQSISVISQDMLSGNHSSNQSPLIPKIMILYIPLFMLYLYLFSFLF